MKFESRLNAVNGMLSQLETRMDAVSDYRAKVSRCYAQSKFYQPGDSLADSDGCVGAGLVNISGKHDIYKSAGGCDGNAEYKIPADVLAKMESGRLYTYFEKMRTRTMDFTVGHSAYRKHKKKVDSSWFNDKHCIVYLRYDGNDTITTRCRGDGSSKCNNNEIRYIEWNGSKMQIGAEQILKARPAG